MKETVGLDSERCHSFLKILIVPVVPTMVVVVSSVWRVGCAGDYGLPAADHGAA